MRVNEIMMKSQQQLRTAQPRKLQQKTDWEKNAAKLRSKDRKLKPQSPVPPIKHRP